jgi:PAS domain S-box-containing protein
MALIESQNYQASCRPRSGAAGRLDRDAPLADGPALKGRLQLRLVIALPVLLVLMAVGYGLVSYLSFSNHWEALERLGAAQIASDLLETHLEAMLLLAIVGMISGVVLAWAILRPIQALVETTRLVASGQLDRHTPPVNAAPELEALSHSFNEMIDRLNASIAERNRVLIEGIPIGILTTDLAGRVTAASPVACDILGMPGERLIGRTVGELTEIQGREGRMLLECLVRSFQDHPEPSSRQTGETYPLTKAYLRDAGGRPTGIVFSFREPAAVRELSAHLRRTDELASLGTFALGLAHQLRNPLGAVKGLSQLMLLERELPARVRDYLGRTVGEIDRVDRFVGQLLSLSEQPLGPPEPTDLLAALHAALEQTRRELEPERAVAARLREALVPLPPLLLERERVTHALAQILRNAFHFTPQGETITLSSRAGDDGWAATLRIHNTGSTIAPDDRRRVFEPFFTTGERATGLGLTFAREIIAQNGGALELEVDEAGVALVVRFGAGRVVAGANAPREAEA